MPSGTAELRAELDRRVDAIESAYEMMLAYAAQGLPGDAAGGAGGALRDSLARFEEALVDLAGVCRDLVVATHPERLVACEEFLQVLERDARATRAALRLVSNRPSISSQLIDNLNASIHVRALLTDLFLIDEAMK